MATKGKTKWRFVKSALLNNDPIFMALLFSAAFVAMAGPYLTMH
tara:strand:+ start:262 stop:393 length:132 start_codon:yes stop_codon:yes gene_type:complete